MAKAYVGMRGQDGVARVWYRQGKRLIPLPLRLDLWGHSPDGFEWGYGGSGPAQTALAILAHCTGCDHLALLLHQQFKAGVVIHMDRKGWTMNGEEVTAWVLQACERRLCPPVTYSVKGVARES